jgi:hypothetical protein
VGEGLLVTATSPFSSDSGDGVLPLKRERERERERESRG